MRTKLENSLVFGTVEAVFSVGEYFVLVLLCPTLAGLVLSLLDNPPSYPLVIRSCGFSDDQTAEGFGVMWQWAQTIGCVVSSDAFVIVLHAVLATLACLAVTGWMVYRCVRASQRKLRSLPQWLGLLNPVVSNLAVKLIAYQLCITAVLIGLQAVTGNWYMGFSNFLAPDASADPSGETPKLVGYYNVFNLVFFDPIKEEIVFRGCLFYVLYHRSPKAIPCAVIANVLFGLFHLINLFNGRFSSVYVLLQVVLGLEIGLFYSARFLLMESIWESIALHVANNMIASCIPIKDATTFSHPLVLLALIQTLVLYAVLNAYSWRRVVANPAFRLQRQ